MSIPRIIHQTWKTREIPLEYRPYVETVKALHPSYEYELWTDEDNRRLIANRYPWFLDTYHAYKHGIERADAVRYFILYTHGGIYVDLDMEFLKPMDELLVGDGQERELFFSLEAGPSIFDTVISNAFMAAPKAHPFFHHIMKNLSRFRKRDITFADVFRNTGPDMLTEQIAAMRGAYPLRTIGLDAICPKGVLPQNKAVGFADIETIRAERRLHAIHHNTESWNVQLPAPEGEIEGYVLFENADVPGQDIDYVECSHGSYLPLLEASNRNDAAIGFNYNGFVKGPGGKLEKEPAPSTWLKRGIVPWVCIKKNKIELVGA